MNVTITAAAHNRSTRSGASAASNSNGSVSSTSVAVVLGHTAADPDERRLRKQFTVARGAGDPLGLVDQGVWIAAARE